MNSCEPRVYIYFFSVSLWTKSVHLFFQCQLVLQHLTLNRAEFLQHFTLDRAEFLQHLTVHCAEFLQHLTLHRTEFLQHDVKSCRISAALDVTLCIVHLLNVQRILGTFIMFNKPCSGKWNICMGKMLWNLTVRWVKQSFALLKRPFSFLRENRNISRAIIYEKIPCFLPR